MKILKILNSQDLPTGPNRNDNYIYFCYDKLTIYMGKVQYTDPYCIVDTLPASDAEPVPNMLYILKDGKTYVYNNEDQWNQIARIENASQAEYLVKAGTTFLMRSGYRYIDKVTKDIDLPFQNGSYQLSVAIKNPIKIDESTIIVYNPETGQFEIDGERYYDEFGRNPDIMKYTALNTNSVNTTIENDHIGANVKISPNAGNLIQLLGTGLYATIDDLVSASDFDELLTRCQSQAITYSNELEEIRIAMDQYDVTLNDQTLNERILEVVRTYIPNISGALAQFDALYEYLMRLLNTEIYAYTDNRATTAKNELENLLNDFSIDWGELTKGLKVVLSADPNVSGNYFITVTEKPQSSMKVAFTGGTLVYPPGSVITIDNNIYKYINNSTTSFDLSGFSTITVICGTVSSNKLTISATGYADVIGAT